jgi:AraC-like DNA-binding protein
MTMNDFTPCFYSFRPPPDLQPYIKVIYLVESPFIGIKQFIPAWNKSYITLQYSDPVYSTINGKPEVVNNVTVSGYISKKYEFFTPASVIKLLLVEFTDTGMYAMLHENSTAFANSSVDLMDVIPRRFQQEICEALYETQDITRKVSLVENFLRQLLPNKTCRKLQIIQSVLKSMASSNYTLPTHTLAKKHQYSERSLQRTFKEIIGISPKTYSRTERFNRSLNKMISMEDVFPTPDEYHDQSHFIKDFKTFSGYAPSQLPAEKFFFYHLLTR